MAMRERQIEIDIGELSLHGVPAADRDAVGDALRAELSTLVANGGVGSLLSRPEKASPAAPADVTMKAGARPADLGAQIARTIYQGWR